MFNFHPSRRVVLTLTCVLMCILVLCTGTASADGAHSLGWCKVNYVCTDPIRHILAVYDELNPAVGFGCYCSAKDGACDDGNGNEVCSPATLPNCQTQYNGETQASEAGSEYGICVDCRNGYQVSHAAVGETQCWSCRASIPTCETCSADKVCSVCDTGYNVSTSGQCVKCSVNNCKTCSTDGVCATCRSGYTSSPGGTACIACPIDKCQSCSTDNVCTQCADDYTVSPDNTTCIPCFIDKCKTCSADNVCHACDGGYTVSSNSSLCFPCEIGGCASCADPTVCRTCSDGYVLTPAKQCAACTAANCARCVSPGDGSTCAECAKGFTGDGDKGTCVVAGTPWWVWLIVGLGVAVIVVVTVITLCCCCDCGNLASSPLDTEAVHLAPVEACDMVRTVQVDEHGEAVVTTNPIAPEGARAVNPGDDPTIEESHSGLAYFIATHRAGNPIAPGAKANAGGGLYGDYDPLDDFVSQPEYLHR